MVANHFIFCGLFPALKTCLFWQTVKDGYAANLLQHKHIWCIIDVSRPLSKISQLPTAFLGLIITEVWTLNPHGFNHHILLWVGGKQ